MQREDDLRALVKIMEFGRVVSTFTLVVHVCVHCYPSMSSWHLNLDVIDQILINSDRATGIFDCILWTKLMTILLLAIPYIGAIGAKGEKITWQRIWTVLAVGVVLFFMNWRLFDLLSPCEAITALYVMTLAAGYLYLLITGLWISRLYKHDLMKDVLNMENKSFMQETGLMKDEYSVNLPTGFQYGGKLNGGQTSVVNPFRATIVLETLGLGRSYTMVNNYIKRAIPKGFSVHIYDYKFDDLSTITYSILLHNTDKYKVKPHFYIVNFDDPHRSHHCSPINPEFMTGISDAYRADYTIMLDLNKTWIEKQGDFSVEPPAILLAAIIWYLKIYKNGIYYSFPHATELLSKSYSDLFTILASCPELENYLSPFMDAWKGGAQGQLQGQIASVKIPLTRMISPQLYWVVTDNDLPLDISSPKGSRILRVGNNPDRQNIYSATLGLYNSRIVKLVDKEGQLKNTVIIDELPTIYFRGLDNLITTARSNKVAVCLGSQDFSRLNRDHSEKESRVVQNTVGNIFSGQVVGETAKALSERFGKILQKQQSVSINRQDVSTSINTQLDSLIPVSEVSDLSQDTFVGSVSNNFGERIDQKVFHAEIIVDHAKVSAEEKAYKKIPIINTFKDSEGDNIMLQQIQRNYDQIKADAQAIINDKMGRMKNDPELYERLGIESAEEDKREAEQIQDDKQVLSQFDF